MKDTWDDKSSKFEKFGRYIDYTYLYIVELSKKIVFK